MPINALIATGGGYRPPDFDYMQNKSNTLAQQGQGLHNQLMQQQVAAAPQRMQMDEQLLQLKQEALELQREAQAQKGKPKISIDLDDITLEGPSDAIAAAASLMAQYPDQVQDPNFMPWLASQGISAKAREKKAYSPKSREEALGFERDKANIKGSIESKTLKTWITADNQVINLPSNVPPPEGSVPYSPGVEFTQTSPEGGTTEVRVGGIPKKKGGGKSMPPQQAIDLAGFKSLNDRVSELVTKISDPNFKDITGPLEGRFQQLKIKFANDGPTQEINNELESLITIAYSLSGKQISEKELKILREAMLPRLTQPKENMLATLNFVLKWVKLEHNNRLDYLKKSGYQSDIKPLEVDQKKNTIGRFTVEVE